MKRYLALTLNLAILLIAYKYAFSSEMHIQDLSAGMFSYPSPDKIPDNGAAVIQNFFTDIQPMAVERNGSVVIDSNVGSNSRYLPGVWKFVDNTGNEWIIEYSSRTYYKHTVGQAPTAFGFTTSSSNIPRAATNLGKIMFVNGVNTPWTFDGTTSVQVSSAPLGSLVASWRTRFVIANIGGSQSTVRFSADGDSTNWTLGPLVTDPFSIQIGGANDGFRVLCIGNYLDYFIIQRKYDTWATSGFDQSDIQTRNVSAEIGCIEPGTNREFDGSYLFLSWRGMEEMAGFTIKPISEPIRNITDILVKNTANQRSNTQTLSSDFAAGTFSDSAIYLDTNTSVGDIQLTFPDTFDTYRNGTSGTKNIWVSSVAFNSPPVSSTITAVSGQLKFDMEPGTLHSSFAQLVTPLLDFQQGTSYYITVSSLTYYPGGFERFYLVFSSRDFHATAAGDPHLNTSNFYWFWSSTSATTVTLNAVADNTADALVLISTTVSPPFTFNVWLSTVNYTYSVNGIWLAGGTHTWPHVRPYVALEYFHGGNVSRGSVAPGQLLLDDFGVAPETATFTSQLLNIGTSINTWSSVTISDSKTNGGIINYQFGSTTTASVASISNYASVSNGAVPTVSTNPYAAFTVAFNDVNSSGTARFSEFTTAWNEGGATPAPISINYDRRYWISLTTNTGTNPTLDSVYVYQRNRTWVYLKGINAASFALWRDNLVFGDSTSSGNVYQFDVGNGDNGNAISSQITTKSYDMGMHYRDKDYRRTYLTFLGGNTGTFNFGFFNEQGTSLYSLGVANMNDGTGHVFEKYHFPLDGTVPLQGREIQYSLTKSGTGDRLKLFDITLDFTPKEAR